MEAASEARALAYDFASTITDEYEFLLVAGSFDPYYDTNTTLRRAQSGGVEPTLAEWLLDDSREYGDISVFDSEEGSSVVFFMSRDDNSYRTVGMRQLLMMAENIDPDEFPGGINDQDYLDALQDAELLLRERAENVYNLFDNAGRTEDALIGLIHEHSDDYNVEAEGLYSNITKFDYQGPSIQTMRVVPELEEWLFAEDRAIGDSQLILTENFGSHLVYFTGFGDVFSDLMADDRIRTSRHDEWYEGLHRGTPVKHAAFILVHH